MQSQFCPFTGEPRDAMWQSVQAIAGLACEPFVIGKSASGCVPIPMMVGFHADVVWQVAQALGNVACPEMAALARWKSAAWQVEQAVGVPA